MVIVMMAAMMMLGDGSDKDEAGLQMGMLLLVAIMVAVLLV